MEICGLVVICWLVAIALASTFLIQFIVKYIQRKPLGSLTLVDLIYCDILRWLLMDCLIFMSAIAGCHLTQR